jgi:hypothetical protein
MEILSIAAGPLIAADVSTCSGPANAPESRKTHKSRSITENNVKIALGAAYTQPHNIPVNSSHANAFQVDWRNCRAEKDSQAQASGMSLHTWHPERWRPDAIHHDDFFQGTSRFHIHRIESTSSWLPSLIVNWDMFRVMFKTAWCARELKVASQWVEQQRNRHAILRKQLFDEAEICRTALRNLSCRYWSQTSPTLLAEGRAQEKILDERFEAIGIRHREIDTDLQKAEQVHQEVFEEYQQGQDDLQVFLDGIFGDIGVLPDTDNIKKAPPIPVLDPDRGEGDLFWDWPENTWNDDHNCIEPSIRSSYHEDPEATWNNSWNDYPHEYDVHWLSASLEKKREQALNAAFDFENFRETYHTQLERYIIDHRREQKDPSVKYPDSNDLEDRFGPVWLSKCQSITREVIRTEQDFFTTEEKLINVKRPDKLLASHDEDGLTHQNLRLSNTQSVADVHNFGELVPSRKRKYIDDWLEAGSMQSKQRKVHVTDDTVSMFDLSERSDQISLAEYAEGYQRRKIDNYICQTREAWPHDSVPAANSELPKEILHELELDAASVD